MLKPLLFALCLLFTLPINAQQGDTLPQAVRGVWLTNVDSEVLYSREGIEQAVDLCAELGINSIFVVTWNKGMTLYPSTVMENFSGQRIDPALDPHNIGRDPLQEIIDAAHKRGIKVFAWFEFGFASSYQQQGGLFAAKKPDWLAKNQHGQLVTKNGFDWLNALNPEVQHFISSLVMEVVNKYDVDGIQGDDRLPAMPSEGGYNPDIVARYQAEHEGRLPPSDHLQPYWLNWRAEILNQYADALYRQVKLAKPQLMVSFSPSVFPWSKQHYLQDWPAWLAQGSVDLLAPQVYRHDIAAYQFALDEMLSFVPSSAKHKVAPGVLIKVGDKLPSKTLFQQMLKANREAGFLGEVFFYYEGLAHFKQEIKASYQQQPVRFPALQE